MKRKETFNNLRVTTLEVARPLINLSAHRGGMIKDFILWFEQNADRDDPKVHAMILKYNQYAVRDQELVDIAQGKAAEEL